MQIHELNNFTGTLGSGAYLAIDDGNDTGKISSQGLLAATEARIDNIIAGPAPSAEEIVDARLGADGVTYPSLGAAIRTQIGDVYIDIDRLASNFFAQSDFRNVADVVVLSGYSMTRNGTTELRASENAIYNAVYLYAKYDLDFYFDSADIQNVGFIDISMIENADPIVQSGTTYIVSGSGAVNYRKSDNNLPTAVTPLHVPKGACVSITEGTSSGNFLVYLNDKKMLTAETLLDNVQMEQVKNYINEDIASQLITRVFEKVDFRNLSGITLLSGYNMTRNGSTQLRASALSGYNACYLYASEEFDIYFEASDITDVGFVDISYIENAQPVVHSGTVYTIDGENAVYYRKSSNDLPTALSPLHVAAGSCVSITQGSSSGNFLVHINDKYELTSDVLLGQVQLDQAKDYIVSSDMKTCKLRYVSATEPYVEIFVPNVDGYVKYVFIHTIDNGINVDVWRVDGAYHVSNSLIQDYALTTAGEWEIAVKIQGRSDFAGGAAHGDEVMSNIVFLVDGVPVTISSLTTLTDFEELYIVETSDLYDPDDHTTVFANHGSVHIFNKDGLTIKQTCKYVAAETITEAYMAMLPIAKTVSNMLVPNKDYVPISINNNRLYDTTGVTVYKTAGNVQANFEVPKFDFFDNNYKFLCLDNGGSSYNKCYFVNTLDALSVSAGTVWASEAKYQFIIGA